MGYQHVVAVLWYWSLLYIQWAYTTSMEESQRGTVHPADVQQDLTTEMSESLHLSSTPCLLLASKLATTPAVRYWSMECKHSYALGVGTT